MFSLFLSFQKHYPEKFKRNSASRTMKRKISFDTNSKFIIYCCKSVIKLLPPFLFLPLAFVHSVIKLHKKYIQNEMEKHIKIIFASILRIKTFHEIIP